MCLADMMNTCLCITVDDGGSFAKRLKKKKEKMMMTHEEEGKRVSPHV